MSNSEQTSIGGYKILRQLGVGGMGAVYEAQHELLGRRAAVKVLLPEYSRDADVVNRFFKEAKASAAIKHPGIVKIYDFGYQEDGSAFIAMEFLEGEGLDTRIERLRKLPMAQALRFVGQMASALAAAHQHNIVHRDLKPQNIFIVPDPQVPGGERIKILDFGIAKFISPDDPGANQTRAGAILGSPLHMAPEQVRGDKAIDHRADLYAVGCMLFEMLCGQPPFDGGGNGPLAVMAAHIDQEPPIPSSLRDDLLPEIDALVLYLLAKDPAMRYQSAADLGNAVSALLGEPVSFTSLAGTTGQFEAITTQAGAVPLSPTGMPLTKSRITAVQASRSGSTQAGGTQIQEQARARKRRTGLGVALAAVLLAAVGIGGIVVLRSRQAAPPPTVAAAETAPEPETKPQTESDSEPERPAKPMFRLLPLDGLGDPGDASATATAGLQVDFSGLQQIFARISEDGISLSEVFSGEVIRTIARTVEQVLTAPPPPPRKITWRFETEVPGAEVLIDGVPVEGKQTPFVLQLDETPGYVAKVTVRKPGYAERTYELKGTKDFGEPIALDPKIRIAVRSKPEGAQIVDAAGTVLGTTPGEIELGQSTAPVMLTLKLEGYEDLPVEVVPDKPKKTDRLVLVKQRAMLVHRIESEPEGATVLKDKTAVGTTPLDVEFLEEKGRIKYVLELEGYATEEIRLRGDKAETKLVKMTKCEDAEKRRRKSRTSLISTGPSLDDIAVQDPC